MSSQPSHCTLAWRAAFALAAIVSFAASAAETNTPAASNAPPQMLAQAWSEPSTSPRAATRDAYPAYQRGVREAATQGPEALRRYVWRTRMIYNFYYYDFAPTY
jgi:hypothetical protein